MLPAWSTMSKCTVSPRASPSRPDGRLTGAEAADGGALAFLAPQLHHRAESADGARKIFERCALGDELAPLGIVGVGQQGRDRHLDEIGVAIESVAVRKGELGAFDLPMDEVRARRIETVEIVSLEQRELLHHHRALAPDAGLAHRVAAVIVGERRLHLRLPARHVVAGEHAAMRRAAGVHHLLRAAETVDRLARRNPATRSCARARSAARGRRLRFPLRRARADRWRTGPDW